jgi:hypothetical protein
MLGENQTLLADVAGLSSIGQFTCCLAHGTHSASRSDMHPNIISSSVFKIYDTIPSSIDIAELYCG